MSLLDLPPELIGVIVDNIRGGRGRGPKPTLCAVSLTCHVLHDHATPLLYSEVYILPSDDRNAHLFSFAETMLNNPHLASFLKYFSGPLYPAPALSDAFEPLKGWLHNIVNLKTLRLFVKHDLLKNPYPNCPFNLESLEINSSAGVLLLEPFLESQPNLFSLKCYRLRTIVPRLLSPRACPRLKVLSGNIHAARTFFPGRRVARFNWTLESAAPSPELINEISDQLNNLRSLSRNGPGSMVPYARLHSLRFLEIQNVYPTDWVSISTLPRLRILLVSEQPTDSIVYEPDQVLKLLALFKKIQTLQCVDIVEFTTYTCSRWLRGAEEPVSVPLWVAEKGRTMFLDDDEEGI